MMWLAWSPHSPAHDVQESVSGVRGIAGASITKDNVARYVAAFASLLRPTAAATSASSNTVVVGRDSRVSGPWIQEVVVSTLTSWGFNVLLLGIVPTPTVSECLPRPSFCNACRWGLMFDVDAPMIHGLIGSILRQGGAGSWRCDRHEQPQPSSMER